VIFSFSSVQNSGSDHEAQIGKLLLGFAGRGEGYFDFRETGTG
jgi:hypothetical protein